MFLIRNSGGAPALWALAIAAPILLLAGCNAAPPSQDEMLASAENMVKPAPGLYRSTSTLTEFELPAANPQDGARMRSMMNVLEPQESTICLSQEQSDEGFVALLRDIQQGDCTVASFEAGSTRFRAELTCPGAGSASSRVVMAGTGTAENSRMELDVEQTGPAIPGGRLEMQFVVENQRIDDC